MALSVKAPLEPMEALSVDEIPGGSHWQYEPKWDGFRCLAFKEETQIELQSKAGQPLARYFPDVVAALRQIKAKRFVLDGEIVVRAGSHLAFDELLMRIHPAASRVDKLAAEHPATYIVFDFLAEARGRSLLAHPLADRRKLLEAFAEKYFTAAGQVRLSPATTDIKTARKWFRSAGASLDGVIANRLDLPYQAGERTGMQKIKPVKTVDCVVGGFRYASSGKHVGSLLLGLYNDDGKLNHVGFMSSFRGAQRAELTPKLEALIKPPGFTGRAPGGPSRWSTKRSTEWQPLQPKLVVEVSYDHFTGGRFRHGTQLLRWRPDKSPRQCTLDQVEHRGGGALKLLAAV